MEISLLFIILSIATLIILSFKYKQKITQELIVAAVISLIWVLSSGIYNYKGENYLIYNINLFPLVLWILGLVIIREIYEKLKGSNYAFIKATGIYWILLIVIEYFGYGMCNIQLNSSYPGLFGWPLLHTPAFAQIYYLSIGPIYLWITDYLKVK